MLRKRSKPVTSSNQTTVSYHNSSFQSQKPISFLFNSPTIFKNFLSPNENSESEEESMNSPSSVLDTRPFSPAKQHQQNSWEKPGIGLALIGDQTPQLGPTTITRIPKQKSKLIVFGSQMKIQIPQPASLFPPTSPQSPIEFGIKTPKSDLKGVSGKGVQKEEDHVWSQSKGMELSEDYTRVISHGPNPKTTHIFGNCIVKSCCNKDSIISGVTKNRFSAGFGEKAERKFPSASGHFSFLSFCHHCNKKIGQGKDIYMYRGERAFCSEECRGQEMLFDEIES